MIIETLPHFYQSELIEKIVSHPLVGGVRYNTGYRSPYSPKETLEKIVELTTKYGKKLWIDLEGRQLRVTGWSWPKKGGQITLNRAIDVDLPAKIHFRSDGWYNLKLFHGKMIFIEPLPKQAIGDGQTVNIQGDNLNIDSYLGGNDYAYIDAAVKLGIFNFMLSFVESLDDLAEFEEALFTSPGYDYSKNPAEAWLKIESLKGLEFLDYYADGLLLKEDYHLIAARDDLLTNIGDNRAMMLPALKKIISLDPDAILASKIFSGLESEGDVSMGDLSDLELMHNWGYKNFMFSDGICQRHFDKAIKSWSDFKEAHNQLLNGGG